jgi:OOP family OmpA-OmpF porin
MAGNGSSNGRQTDEHHIAELRQLLLGPEYALFFDSETRTESIAGVLAEAVRLRSSRDNKLRKALQSTVEEALDISVKRNPRMLAEALFPIFGRAIRRAIASELENVVASANQMMEQRLSWRSLRWRWEALRTGRQYAEIVLARSVLYRVEQVLLIHRETGLPLLEVRAAVDDSARDAEMVSGMLTAIQDFMRDSFTAASEGQLESVKLSTATLIMAHGPKAILAGLVQGSPPYNLRTVFQETIETIHEQHLKALLSFRGDTAAFEVCRPLLEKCLLGQGDTQPSRRRSRRSRFVAAAAVVFVLLFLSLGAWWWWSARNEKRWQGYLARLRAAPGIAVTYSGRVGSKYTVTGLRDPLAADPAVFLKASGLPVNAVETHWATFFSADPQFEALRKFNALKATVERRRIRFPVGKSDIVPPQDSVIEQIAADMKQLEETARSSKRSIRFEVHGDTDPLGTEDLNSTLARDRATAVRNALISFGIPMNYLIPVGRNAGQTCAASTDFGRSICRSASVRVVEQGS